MLWNLREKKESRRRVFGISRRMAYNFNQVVVVEEMLDQRLDRSEGGGCTWSWRRGYQ